MGAKPEARAGLGADGLGELIGLTHVASDERSASAEVKVSDRIRQPFGIVHGGAYSAIAESICSRATGIAVWERGMAAMGQANQASFLKPIAAGTIHAEATVRHRGRTTWVWDCELSDDDGRLCALVRVTIAVRPRPEPGSQTPASAAG